MSAKIISRKAIGIDFRHVAGLDGLPRGRDGRSDRIDKHPARNVAGG